MTICDQTILWRQSATLSYLSLYHIYYINELSVTLNINTKIEFQLISDS